MCTTLLTIRRRTSGSTGTEISGRDLSGKRPLHRLIDFTASELESYQKGCRKQQGWKPAKSRSFLQRFGPSERIAFVIIGTSNALRYGQLSGSAEVCNTLGWSPLL